jgi:protein-histidine pros-kinase
MNVAIRVLVIRPVTHLAQAADEISKGQVNAPDMDARGKDEVSMLAGAFNRMRRSLASAVKMLEQQ